LNGVLLFAYVAWV